MITTSLTTSKGTIKRTGTSGFTVTCQREGDGVDTQIEYSEMKLDEMREMVCVLLCMLDEKEGEQFVTSCFARYAEETHKRFFVQENGRKLVLLKGAHRE